MITTTIDVVNAANEYVDNGLSIIPIGKETKKPLTKWKHFQSNPATSDHIEEWETEFKEFNLAILTGELSGLVVVDTDNAKAEAWWRTHGAHSPLTVKTSRGRHFYYAHPGGQVRNQVKMGGVQGIDLRGDGGYVLCPPSSKWVGDDDGGSEVFYSWEIAAGFNDIEDLPLWAGPIVLAVEADDIDLSNVDPEGQTTIEKMEAHLIEKGKLSDGDGRNNVMAKYIGDLISSSLDGKEVSRLVTKFQDRYFDEPLPNEEVEAAYKSIRTTDKSNHPARYDEEGELKMKRVEDGTLRPSKIPGMFGMSDILGMEYEEPKYIMEPWLKEKSIVQIYGYASHGKSLMSLASAFCIAQGRSFGPFYCTQPYKVLYLDFDMGQGDIIKRMTQFKKTFGDPKENLTYWAQSMQGDSDYDLDFRSDLGRENLDYLVDKTHPDVIFYDNLRTGLPGMSENNSEEWAVINEQAKRMRKKGCAFVMMHHANKPVRDDKGGTHVGGEAGSSNQLTILETQIRVAMVGDEESDYLEMENRLPRDQFLRHPMRVSYGKVRDRDPEVQTQELVGFTRDMMDDTHIISSLSNRQKAYAMRRNGRGIVEICRELKVSKATVQKWHDAADSM